MKKYILSIAIFLFLAAGIANAIGGVTFWYLDGTTLKPVDPTWSIDITGVGDVLSVGDCASGACLDGTSDGGTYIRIYDGNSNYAELNVGNISSDYIVYLPTSTGTLIHTEADPTVDTAGEILAIIDNTALDFGTGVLTATGFVGPLTGAVTGNADTATLAASSTQLAANPTDCSSNQFANAIVASGNLTCAAIIDADIPNTITINLAASSTALAANGANCNAGEYALGIDASGAVESCTDATTEINSVVNGLGGTNLTCSSQNCNVDDAFLINSGSDIAGSGSGFTWTFNASAGTDSVMTFGDGTIDVTTGALKVGGSAVLTTVAYGDLTGNPSDVITAGAGLAWDTDTLNWSATAFDLTSFPADPNADKLLMWDDDPGELIWTAAGAGDVEAVGDCASGLCLDGSSDGGTNITFYNIDSNKTQLIAGDIASDLIITLPGTTGTLVHSGVATLSSLTSIGTIGTGVWEGTAIADGYIPNDITIDLATLSTTLTITDNESTNENNAVLFTAGGALEGGDLGIESDGTFHYNPSTGLVTSTGFAGALTGNADTVTGFTPAGGSLTLAGADALTLTTSAATNVTLPTSGTLVNTGVTTLSSLTSIGTIATGTWEATDIGVAHGGTGVSSFTQYLLLYASTTTSLGQIAIGSAGQVLTSGGAGSAPAFETLSIAAGEYAADSIDYADIVDADQATTKCILIETPADADDLMFFRNNRAVTIISVDCICEAATSAVVVIVECDSAGDNCGSSRFTESLTCDVDGATDDGLAETGVVSGAWLRAQVGTVTGTPGHVTACVTFTYDD